MVVFTPFENSGIPFGTIVTNVQEDLEREDLEEFVSRGWKVMQMKYPWRILTGHPEYDLDVEVFEIKVCPCDKDKCSKFRFMLFNLGFEI